MRLRMTALPVFFVAVRPNRIGVGLASTGSRWRACSTKPRRTCFSALAAARKSRRMRILESAGPACVIARPPDNRRKPSELCRQALTPTGAAAGQNQTAAFGGHAGAKTVAAFAHQIARLKCSFHGLHSLKGRPRVAHLPKNLVYVGRM